MSHIQTNYKATSSSYVHSKFAGKLCICFSCFQSSSWWCPNEECPIHVTCETASCSSRVHISLVPLKQNNWLLTDIEAIHWSKISILYPNLVHFHAFGDVFKFLKFFLASCLKDSLHCLILFAYCFIFIWQCQQ